MSDPGPELSRALQEGVIRLEALRVELLERWPVLRGNLAVSGAFVGHGLGAFVANGLTDDEIVRQVRGMLAQIRDRFAAIRQA